MHYHTVSHVLVFIIPPSSPSLHCVTFNILLQCRSSRRKWKIFHTTTLSFTAQRRVSTLTFHHCCHLRSSSFWKRHRIWGREIVYKKPCLPHLPLLEDLEIGGWTHLHDNIVNHITRRIHNNPYFLPALTLQFEGQGTIFREDQQALEGLHIVCRRLEWDAVEYIVHAQKHMWEFQVAVNRGLIRWEERRVASSQRKQIQRRGKEGMQDWSFECCSWAYFKESHTEREIKEWQLRCSVFRNPTRVFIYMRESEMR